MKKDMNKIATMKKTIILYALFSLAIIGIYVLCAIQMQKLCPCDTQNSLHICAFHLKQDNKQIQFNVHHYCTPVPASNGLFQCILYDDQKRLIGVEYVVSDEIYQTFDNDEKKLWHSHKYEITEGLLVMPDLPKDCEKKYAKNLLNSWGKSVHSWPDISKPLPLGLPVIFWSANKDGEVDNGLIKQRDAILGINTNKIREERNEYLKEQ